MASVTRSNRRAEGLHPHHHNVNASGPLTRSGPGPSLFHQAPGGVGVGVGGRTKRALDVDRDFEPIKPKKARITVEILSKPPPSPPSEIVNVHPSPIPRQPAAANSANSANSRPAAPAPPAMPTPPVAPEDDHSLTKHQAKVINGIKHELDRLQPRPSDTREQGRKLRSQEATRFKSELSAYFPDYDEVIGNDPKEQHLLNVDTPIVVFDSTLARAVQQPHHQNHSADFPVRGYGDALFTDVFDSQRIDFGFLEAQHKNKNILDPLPDGLFEPIHKRAERLERSIRNTEKGRAQHEKDQIIRLLEGLQGHDWLRVMGVSGVTETKKRAFEPARIHFVKGCQAILDKFRNWSLEEKRRKLEKERALAEKAEKESEFDNDDDGGGEDGPLKGQGDDEDDAEEPATSQDDASEASSPAKQLRQEARARSKLAYKRPRPARKPTPPTKPPEPPQEFKSFFSKRYERDGALNRHRRAGRKVLAWGHSIPDIPEADFELPEEYRDEDTLRARARKKRRDRREHRLSK